ncbi:N-acetylglucosamine-6-phosphate deacetylase [Pseudothermotoga sp.]|nr:N-acetylglucosamine-6-phosphate deacetylase [Pseudothermotoga sp.]
MKLRAKRLFTPLREFEEVCVTIRNDRIVSIEKDNLVAQRSYPILAPAFIDSHTHGAIGIDVMRAKIEDLARLSLFYAEHGVGCFFPTTVSDSFENISKVASTVREAMDNRELASKIGGLYVEGPYLNPTKSGAHKREMIKHPDLDELEHFLTGFGDVIKIFAIAPELNGAKEAINLLRRHKVIVSIAHTNATYDQTMDAIRAGARRATHVFNAMKQFDHREPGVLGAVLTNEKIYCELICDFVHLHPTTVKLAMKIKGVFKSFLVSDSISATGLNNGVYELGQMNVEVRDGVAKLLGKNTLAGSTLTIDQAVRNLVFKLDVPLRSALIMASFTPAKASGLSDGFIAEGQVANLVALDDELNVVALYVEGRLVYSV